MAFNGTRWFNNLPSFTCVDLKRTDSGEGQSLRRLASSG
jgi:hypothetical protein